MILVTGVILISDSDAQAGKTISQSSLQFVLAKSSSIIGRWDLVWRPSKNMIMYRVFQNDGQAIKYTALLDNNGKPTGAGQKKAANYKINSDGTIQIFNELREKKIIYDKNREIIQDKMKILEGRNRMLQISMDKNIFSKKVVYILLTIVICIILIILFAISFFKSN
jgi:hypothetical protein